MPAKAKKPVNLKHVCVNCRHEWSSLEQETAKGIIKAAEVNKEGPYCALCMHIKMAERYSHPRALYAIRNKLAEMFVNLAKSKS